MYTEESILAVRHADIAEVIGHFVKLDQHNKACCPIHNEKTPSFSVNARKGIFKCFGCGVGGDAITFVKALNDCDFIRAIEIIADLQGITLEEDNRIDGQKYKAFKAEQKSLRDVIAKAHATYRQLLSKTDSAKSYWYNRGYDDDVLTKWQLGFAPHDTRFLTRDYTHEGLLPAALKLGLIKENNEKLHLDCFINRVIIPIHDEHGELVSLAGRKLEDSSKYPKYINGAASPLYNKSKTLFGLYHAIPAIKREKFAILVEGYTDVISLHLAGADNAVASCGTAFTEDMGRLLKRYTTHVVIMRDADTAGESAEDKDLDILLRLGFRVDIMPLPDQEDPDLFAKSYIIEYNEEDLSIEDEAVSDISSTDRTPLGIALHSLLNDSLDHTESSF